MIFLSVILPTCNRSNRLERAVDSVLKQYFKELEIIIVDDSKNNTVEIIKEKFSELDNIQVFRSGAGSASKARNLGVSKASGKYITFIDDDDMYMQGRLESIFYYIFKSELNKTKFSFFSAGRFQEKNNFQEIKLIKNQKYGIVNLENNIYRNDIDIGFVIRKDLFISLGGFDESLSALEDWDFIIRALKVNPGFKVNRLDYAVNIDSELERVSNRQHYSLITLANKHKAILGNKWFYTICSRGEYLSGTLKLFAAIKYCFNTQNIIPIWLYLKLILIKPLYEYIRNIFKVK